MFAPYNNITEALFGSETLDESLRVLADMLYQRVNADNIEIEGKIGKMMKKGGQDTPLFIPQVRTETILNDPQSYFKSTLTLHAFDNLNRMMNERFKVLHENKEYHGPKIQYSKVKEIDQFFSNGKESIRVSLDPTTLEPKRAIQKTKLQSIDFLCPHNTWDFRITVSEEKVVDMPDSSYHVTHERSKDRLSYSFDIYQIDITVVKDRRIHNGTFGEYNQPTYEVEMECSTDAFLKEKKLMMEKSNNNFTGMCKNFLSTMRTLAKHSGTKPKIEASKRKENENDLKRRRVDTEQ